jgi:hypothetical protein
MPYLASKKRRAELADALKPVKLADGAEFNYVICHLADRFVGEHGLQYHTLEEIKGAIFGAVAEFHDRVVRPYEDIKRRENGDVFRRCEKELSARWGAILTRRRAQS